MTGAASVAPVDVIDFWFGAPDSPERTRFRDQWFKADAAFDDEIRRRFLLVWKTLRDGGLEHWHDTPEHALAYVIVADQFPRNCFRGTAIAFATDALALAAATRLVDAGDDSKLAPLQRSFVYLPFEHAESLAMQNRSVQLFETLVSAHAQMNNVLDYARRHRDVIKRFGRFPHRNAALGRTSTPEERSFLTEPGSSF